MASRHVLRTIPGLIGVVSLIATAFILVILLNPSIPIDYVDEALVIISVGSVGHAAGAAMYRQRIRRVALGIVAGMIGWASVFLGLSTMNREIQVFGADLGVIRGLSGAIRGFGLIRNGVVETPNQ